MTIEELMENEVCIALQKIGRFIWIAALWLWQLPQNLLGLAVRKLYGPCTCIESGECTSVHVSGRMPGGISLGKYIIISKYQCTRTTVAHERGHAVQSRILGPFYLFVIGLPSIAWAWLHSRIAPQKSYYWFYTERWADKLGKVRR